MTPARATIAGTASTVAAATNAKRGDRPRRSRSYTNARGSVVMPKRLIAVEIAKRRTTVCAAKSTPSSVASNGPIVNRTVVPARVNTLTRTTDTAIGSVRRSETRTSRRKTRATAAQARTMTMIAIGPAYPPRTNAPTDATVAMTAFVVGFSR